MYPQARLKSIAEDCAAKISAASEEIGYFENPFKHIVIDDFLDISLANFCLDQFPALTESSWEYSNDHDIEVKYRTTWKSEFDVPEGIVSAVRILNCSLLLSAMGQRLGIPKLIPDPYFTGGGLNATTKGGLLDVHVDGNYHDATGLNRRVNAILYLNKGWTESWGGELGLYDENGEVCVKKIAPIFNRLIVFESHDKSFHGLPEPLAFPSETPRKSIILYYYTRAGRPDEQVVVKEPHSALWRGRNLLDKRGKKIRDFT